MSVLSKTIKALRNFGMSSVEETRLEALKDCHRRLYTAKLTLHGAQNDLRFIEERIRILEEMTKP